MNKSIVTLSLALLVGAGSVSAQQGTAPNAYLQKINKLLPHQFKTLKTAATLEAVREKDVVKVYLLVDDIEQYDQLLVERSDETQTNYSQCKVIQVEKGKYPNNYIEVVDRYPLSPKMSNLYRLKSIDKDGILRMYPPVSITFAEEAKK